mgnify:CR=1 FL=1
METRTRERTSKTSKKNKKKSSGKIVRIMLIVLAALLVVLGTLYYFIIYREQQRQQIMNSTTFHDGVTVNGVDISGQTLNEAKATLASTAEKEIADGVHLTFTCNGKSYTADSSKFTVTCNTEEILNEAMSLAREGDYQALTAELKDIKENGRAYTIDYTVEPTGVESFIHSFADEVTTPATPASFTVHYPEKSTKTNAYDTSDLGLVGEEAKKAGLGADKQAITDPRDVFFDFTEPVDGYGVDVDALMATVRTRCESKDFGDIEVAMAPIHSDVTVEKLKESLFLRGTASTTYKSKRRNTNRCHNLEKACGMVYGTVLQPGEEFSANTILGDRTLSNGWKPAPAVIAGGADHEDQPGGGVCQTSSTLFNAVVRADLEIVKRSAHSWPSSYVNKGEDATVNWPSLDFVFRNNGDYPVFVIAWYENQTVTVQIYGKLLPNGQTVDLESEVIKTIKPDDAVLYTLDASLPVGTRKAGRKKRTGYVVDTYKVYKDASGNVTEKKKLWTTTYRAMQDEILYNDGSGAASNE